MNRSLATTLLAALALGCATPPPAAERMPPRLKPRPWPPRSYTCPRATEAPAIDGRLDDAAWAAAPWTESFVDIEGDRKPLPRWKTRAKMLWDDECLYVAAELEEPNVWATLVRRDSVIFHDNDFEVFVDPDGDTHRYGELEINALGTEWDLFLERPYRDGVKARDAWDIEGLRSAVRVEGTLNDPRDVDRGWTVEIALPFAGLAELRDGNPLAPEPGDVWRVNFSRVQWRVDYVGPERRYERVRDPVTGERLPEDNWVWSPQGEIAMHAPERWGFVVFADAGAGEPMEPFRHDPVEDAKIALREVYRAQRAYRDRYGKWAGDLAALGLASPPEVLAGWERPPAAPRIRLDGGGYRVKLELEDGRAVELDAAGRVVVVEE